MEIELKFQVPAEALAGVRRALATRASHRERLRAAYFDTPDRRLAAAGLALRLRLEGAQWVQTIKGRGDGRLARPEHEVPLPGTARDVSSMPPLDLARHAGSWAEAALARALADSAALQPVFETDVERLSRLVRRGRSVVELALDVGVLQAGGAQAPVCELEFELKRGPPDELFALATRWSRRHGLWLDVRSKAERGERLARGLTTGPVVGALPPALDRHDTPQAALRAIVSAALAQALPNAAELAAGDGTPEHLHQLRVGLRRLRTALRVFGGGVQGIDPDWAQGLATLFARLGAARDRDVLAATILPALRAAGAPLADLPAETGASDDVASALRAPETAALWVALIAFAHDSALAHAVEAAKRPAGSDRPKSTAAEDDRWAREVLRGLRRRLRADARAFGAMDDASRHRTRRRLKRLRYALEFTAALWPKRRLKAWLRRLQRVQNLLGRHQDLCAAEAAFRTHAETDPRAWFAVGWLAAQREALVPEANLALQRLARLRAPWRRKG